MDEFKERCAIKAMGEILKGQMSDIGVYDIQDVVLSAFEIADAMTNERNRRLQDGEKPLETKTSSYLRVVEPSDLVVNAQYWMGGENGDTMSGQWVKLLKVILEYNIKDTRLLVETSKSFGDSQWVSIGELYILDKPQ